MASTQTETAPFYPPCVTPPPKPLGFPHNLRKLLGNNLEAIPEEAYHRSVVAAPGPPRMAFITDPDIVETILLERFEAFPKGRLQVEVLKPLFGNAMHAKEGAEWKWQRGAVAPLFRHSELLQYGPTMTAVAEATVEDWRNHPTGATRAVEHDMIHAAYEVVSSTILAGDAGGVAAAIEHGRSDYFDGVNWWVVYSILRLPHWLPRPRGRRMRAQERRIRQGVADLVEARRGANGRNDDMLARWLGATDPETGHTMSDDILVDNIVSFLVSGFDTTALSLTWALYLISRSPEWEGRMLEEIERVVGNDPVTAEALPKLIVVQQVLNEAMRLYPAAPMIVRDIIEDMELGGVPLKAGTIGLIPIYAIHRHRKYWDDPDRFDPSRFSPDAKAKHSRYQFIPFGAGPRICIGAAFSMMEATIMLATFVRAARFQTAPNFDPDPTAQMFLLPRNGMPMTVTMRDRTASATAVQ